MNKNFELLGRYWNAKCLEVIKLDGEIYVLNNWNGETYNNCFKLDSNLIDVIEDGKKYMIKPEYMEIGDDEWELIEYNIVG